MRTSKTLQLWHVLSPITAKAGYNALVDVAKRYEAKTQIHVALSFVQFTEAGAFQEKVNAAAASNTPPDIVMLSGPTNYAFTGAARPLDSYLSSSSAVKKADFIPGQWARCMWMNRCYGVPIGADANALFWWNRDIFKKNGLNPDQPPTTWAELATVNEKLLKRDSSGHVSSYGFIPNFGQAWPLVWYYLQGPTSVSRMTSRPRCCSTTPMA